MNRRQALGLAGAALLLAGCGAPAEEAPVAPSPRPLPSLGAPVEVIAVDSPRTGELHLVHDLADSPALWAPMPRDAALDDYRARLAARLGGDLSPRALLARQRAVMAAIGTESARGDAENATLVLDGAVGTIGPVCLLETLLLRQQAGRFPILEHPSELGAFILRGKGRVRVYFSSFESVGGKIRHEVNERVLADAARGFEVTAHLHNHPFLFDRVPGDRMWTTPETVADVAGALAPSTNDVRFYLGAREEMGLRAAWVTNGLDTARFDAHELDRFRAAAG